MYATVEANAGRNTKLPQFPYRICDGLIYAHNGQAHSGHRMPRAINLAQALAPLFQPTRAIVAPFQQGGRGGRGQ